MGSSHTSPHESKVVASESATGLPVLASVGSVATAHTPCHVPAPSPSRMFLVTTVPSSVQSEHEREPEAVRKTSPGSVDGGNEAHVTSISSAAVTSTGQHEPADPPPTCEVVNKQLTPEVSDTLTASAAQFQVRHSRFHLALSSPLTMCVCVLFFVQYCERRHFQG